MTNFQHLVGDPWLSNTGHWFTIQHGNLEMVQRSVNSCQVHGECVKFSNDWLNVKNKKYHQNQLIIFLKDNCVIPCQRWKIRVILVTRPSLFAFFCNHVLFNFAVTMSMFLKFAVIKHTNKIIDKTINAPEINIMGIHWLLCHIFQF